jgi:hypothetical protein
VSSGEAVENWDREFVQQVHENFLQCVALIRVLRAIEHFAENDTADSLKLTGLLQVSDHTVDLIRLGIGVLQNEYCVVGIDFVLCPESRDDEGQASTNQAALAEP